MAETTRVKKVGNSLGLIFDKGVLEKVYHLTEGSEVEIEYAVPQIIIKPKCAGTLEVLPDATGGGI